MKQCQILRKLLLSMKHTVVQWTNGEPFVLFFSRSKRKAQKYLDKCLYSNAYIETLEVK